MSLVSRFDSHLASPTPAQMARLVPTDWYEATARELLRQADNGERDEALGGLGVVLATLIEKVKQADPAYGLEVENSEQTQ